MEANADYLCIGILEWWVEEHDERAICTINVKFRAKTKMFNSTMRKMRNVVGTVRTNVLIVYAL